MQLISQAEYARMRGCTEGAVRRAVRDKRIALIDGKIDPVAADAQWSRNTRVRLGSRPAVTDDAAMRATPAQPPLLAPGAEPPAAEKVVDYYEAKRQREVAEAELAQLRLAELRGELVRADEVRSTYARRIAALRESLLQIPSRLAAVLAAESDIAKVHDAIQLELHQVLEQS